MGRGKLVAIDNKWWVLLAVGVGSMLGGIDLSVVNIALPVIRREFACNVATIEWAVTIYLLIVCGSLLSFGRLGDLRRREAPYTSSALLSSCLGFSGLRRCGERDGADCGTRLPGAGGFHALCQCSGDYNGQLPGVAARPGARPATIMVYLGQMTGPVLGGWMTDHFSWRSVFFINLPVGILALWLSAKFIPRDEPKEQTETFDFAGGGLFMASFTVLLLGPNQGYDRGWTSPSIEGLLAGAVLLLIMFVLSRASHASSAARLKPVSRTAVCNEHGQCGIELHLFLYNHVSYAVLPDSGASIDPQSRGTIDHSSAGGDERLRSHQRHAFRSRWVRAGLRWQAWRSWASGCFCSRACNPTLPLGSLAWEWACVDSGREFSSTPNNSALMGSRRRAGKEIAGGVLGTARYVGMILGARALAGADLHYFLIGIRRRHY